MRRRTAAGIFIAALATMMTQTGIASASQATDETHLRALINSERTTRSLAALDGMADLDAIARRHSADMAADGRIYHSKNLRKEIDGCWTLIGENVGMGGSVDDIHEAFMDSASHRSNVLERDFNEFGIGVVTTDDGVVYITETFAERRCAPQTQPQQTSKVLRHVRAQARRTPPPHAVRAHMQHAPSVARVATRNVDLLLRMIALDSDD